MNKIKIKAFTGCMVCTVMISANALTTQAITVATELPMAGITLALNDKYSVNPETADTEIKEYLEPSEYADIAIAQVSYYVNMRSEPNEESEVLGKIYNNSAATILETDGDWYQVKSGTVTGYIKAEYFITGEAAEELAKEVGSRIAKVTTTTLKVRDDASLDATVQTLVPIDEELQVVEELDGWVKVQIDSDVVGYVSSEYVELRTDFVEAESIEEEKARLEKAEAERKAAEEAARAADEAAKKEAAAKIAASKAASNKAAASKAKSTITESSKSTSSSSTEAAATPAATSGSRQAIVSYALKFVGNPYVWGGTSLTAGADCSGFTQSVFRDNGISISRTSRTQGAGGKEISVGSIQPGDLLFYASGGTINHVAIYIGNGQVVHASNEKTGIKISNAFYRTPYKAVSYIN